MRRRNEEPSSATTSFKENDMNCCGIRGAIDVSHNGAEEILAATRTLLERMIAENAIEAEDIASVIFSATPDLDAVAPARAAREMGWMKTPLFCVQEMSVRGALPRCIRVLMHVNGNRTPNEVRHVYLGAAQSLRPDWTEEVVT
jgi:chorismate mutase